MLNEVQTSSVIFYNHAGDINNPGKLLIRDTFNIQSCCYVFKSEGAESNRLSISLSVLFSETPNPRGAKAPPLTTALTYTKSRVYSFFTP